MKKLKYVVVILLVVVTVVVFSQNKKTAKSHKLKSSTVWQTDIDNGKSVTYKDSYEEFDKNGHSLQKIDYKKDGTVKKKSTAVYDNFQNKIEENRI